LNALRIFPAYAPAELLIMYIIPEGMVLIGENPSTLVSEILYGNILFFCIETFFFWCEDFLFYGFYFLELLVIIAKQQEEIYYRGFLL